MQLYLVGGAVRDALLGLPVTDHDWVVVGATPEALIAQGFLPVGKDFPVFLHPRTQEEYALARIERKTGPGYHGFSVHAAPDVTLEEDLARRDLTVNAMAVRADCAQPADLFSARCTIDPAHWVETGTLIDPFDGRKDIAAKLLRHVTASFREDPVRILRVARFAARFADFTVAPQTMQLMLEMVQCGEVDHLVPERVWQEMATGLMENTPSRMFERLRDCGALARLLPELAWTSKTGSLPGALDVAARLQTTLPVRVACLWLASATKQLESDPHLFKRLALRLRLPNDCRELAEVVAREHDNIDRSAGLDPSALLDLLERCDAIRKPQRFTEVLLACECAALARPEASDSPYLPARRLMRVLASAQAVATQAIATQAMADGLDGKQIGELIKQARIEAIRERIAPA